MQRLEKTLGLEGENKGTKPSKYDFFFFNVDLPAAAPLLKTRSSALYTHRQPVIILNQFLRGYH